MSSPSGDQRLADLADRLHRARLERTPTPMLTADVPSLSADEAYAIQDHGIRLRRTEGEAVIGAKLGFTSPAMRAAMGVTSPNYGWLTDAMMCGGVVDLTDFIHPKLEPEIAFVLSRDLSGPYVRAEHVIAASGFVTPVLEIVDSRYVDFQFTASDNTADNSSAGAIAIGARLTPAAGLELRTLGVVLSVNGEIAHTAAGAAVAGHPAESVAWLVRRLATRGCGLRAGHIVISGGLTGPTDLSPGMHVMLEIDRLGTAELRIEA